MKDTDFQYQRKNTFLSRLADLARYFYPIVKWQMICYLIIAAGCAALILLPAGQMAQFGLFTTIWSMIPLLFELSPLVFARNGDSRMVERQIPVPAGVKMTFYLAYLFVIALILYPLPELAGWLYTKIPSIQNDTMKTLLELRYKSNTLILIINIVTLMIGCLTCLCVVLRAKNNRILKAVISVFGVQFAIGLIGGIYGIYMAFTKGLTDGANNATPMEQITSQQEIVDKLMSINEAVIFQTAALTIEGCYLVFILYLIYKTLSRGGSRL